MSRLIDADEIRIKPDFIFYGVCGTPVIRCEDLARIINDMPTIEPQKWIPISVKLPEKRQDVIVTVNDGMIYTDTDEWIGTGFFAYGHNVVAWQSLPNPWKGEEQ